MQSTMRIILPFFLISSAIAGSIHTGVKLRRNDLYNIVPYPRIGRSPGRSTANAWQYPFNTMFFNNDAAGDKRLVVAFPRIGRSDVSITRGSQEYEPMPIRRTESPGMWFGPRLGRSFANDNDDLILRNDNIERGDIEQAEIENDERKKRQAN